MRPYIFHVADGEDSLRIRRLVLDAAIPTKGTSLIKLAESLLKVDGVRAVNITVDDVDVEVLGLIVVVEGDDIDYGEVERAIEKAGGVIHSLDQVVAGEYIVELAQTLNRRS